MAVVSLTHRVRVCSCRAAEVWLCWEAIWVTHVLARGGRGEALAAVVLVEPHRHHEAHGADLAYRRSQLLFAILLGAASFVRVSDHFKRALRAAWRLGLRASRSLSVVERLA